MTTDRELLELTANEPVKIEIFGKTVSAMKMIHGLAECAAEYQTAVEEILRDASIALGCGELLDADELRVTLGRICDRAELAFENVRRSQEASRPQMVRELVTTRG